MLIIFGRLPCNNPYPFFMFFLRSRICSKVRKLPIAGKSCLRVSFKNVHAYSDAIAESRISGNRELRFPVSTESANRSHHKVDERYHIEKETRDACRYLKEAYEKNKDWVDVAACVIRTTPFVPIISTYELCVWSLDNCP